MAVMLAADILVFSANPWVALSAAAAAVLALGALASAYPELAAEPAAEQVDLVLARLEERPGAATVVSGWSVWGSAATARPVRTALLVLIPLAADAAMGFVGAIPGVAAGLLLVAAGVGSAAPALLLRRAWRCVVLTEAIPTPLPRRRYFR